MIFNAETKILFAETAFECDKIRLFYKGFKQIGNTNTFKMIEESK